MIKLKGDKIFFQNVELFGVLVNRSAYDDLILSDSIEKAKNDLNKYFKSYKIINSKRVAESIACYEFKVELYSKKYDNKITRSFFIIQDKNRFIINF